MKFDTLLYEVTERVATVTLNRPEKRNVLSPQVIQELTHALGAADNDDSVGSIVLTGAGEKAFCAGADLAGSMVAGEGVYGRHEAGRRFLDLFRAMESGGKPILCAAQGSFYGGGLGLALACDIVVAVDGIQLGTPEISLGLFPHVIMATIFRNVANPKKVWELVLTGDRITAQEALNLGMINHVVSREEFSPKVTALARKLAGWSPAAIRLGRRSFYTMRDMSFSQAMEYLQTVLTVNTLTEDAMEGVSAFFEKRPASWKGR